MEALSHGSGETFAHACRVVAPLRTGTFQCRLPFALSRTLKMAQLLIGMACDVDPESHANAGAADFGTRVLNDGIWFLPNPIHPCNEPGPLPQGTLR